MLNKLNNLRNIGINEYSDFVTYYKDNEEDIDNLVNSDRDNSIFMYYNGTEEQKNIIKFLSIFSKKTNILISIEKTPDGLYNHSWTIPIQINKKIKYSDLVKYTFEKDIEKSFISPIYLSFPNKNMSSILKETKKLSDLGLITIRPSKAILKFVGKGNERYIPGVSK